MNGREPVAELVRDARGQLPDLGQAVLQPQLLLELDDVGQIAEEADGAIARSGDGLDRRHRDAEVRRPIAARREADGAAADRVPRVEALLDDPGQRRRREQHGADVAAPVRFGHAEQAAAGGIERFDAAILADDEQARRQAGDDLAAQPLGRLGARRHRLFPHAQARQRVLHRRGHEGGFGAGPLAPGHLARRREEAQDREGQAGDHQPERDGQQKEDERSLRHGATSSRDTRPGSARRRGSRPAPRTPASCRTARASPCRRGGWQ